MLFGIAVGWLVLLYFGSHGFSIPGMESMADRFNLPARIYPRPTLMSLLSGPAVVLLFTVLAALYPASRLRRLSPVTAMRAV